MGRLTLFALTIAGLLLVPGPTLAETANAGDLAVEKAWSRATPAGAEVAAGYLTIVNRGDAPDRLVSVTTSVAGNTEIHQMKMVDGKVEMRPVLSGIEIPAKGTVALEPMGYHLMLMGLRAPLKKGEMFTGSLIFEHAGAVDATFRVEGIGAMGLNGE
jgi:copper(I)-binding protein